MTPQRSELETVLAARIRVPGHVMRRTFPEETIALNLDTGMYHGLNATGGEMLEALARHGSVRAAAGALTPRLGATRAELERDLGHFVLDLAQRGLVELVER